MVRALPLLNAEQMKPDGVHGESERVEMPRRSLSRAQDAKKDQERDMLSSSVMLSPFDGVYPELGRSAQGRHGLVELGPDPSLRLP